MGLFGLFKKKDKTSEIKSTLNTPPSPPKPPTPQNYSSSDSYSRTPEKMSISTPTFSVQKPMMNTLPEPTAPKQSERQNIERRIEKPRNIDDFGIPSPGMEIPDFELPDLEIYTESSEEITQAIRKATVAEKEIKEKMNTAKKAAPKKIPQIEIIDENAPKPIKEIKPKRKQVEDMLPNIEAPENLPVSTIKGAIFISSTQFNNVKNTLSTVKGNLKNAEEVLNKLNGLKNMQDSAFESWHGSVESIQRKLIMIDTLLFEKGQE